MGTKRGKRKHSTDVQPNAMKPKQKCPSPAGKGSEDDTTLLRPSTAGPTLGRCRENGQPNSRHTVQTTTRDPTESSEQEAEIEPERSPDRREGTTSAETGEDAEEKENKLNEDTDCQPPEDRTNAEIFPREGKTTQRAESVDEEEKQNQTEKKTKFRPEENLTKVETNPGERKMTRMTEQPDQEAKQKEINEAAEDWRLKDNTTTDSLQRKSFTMQKADLVGEEKRENEITVAVGCRPQEYCTKEDLHRENFIQKAELLDEKGKENLISRDAICNCLENSTNTKQLPRKSVTTQNERLLAGEENAKKVYTDADTQASQYKTADEDSFRQSRATPKTDSFHVSGQVVNQSKCGDEVQTQYPESINDKAEADKQKSTNQVQPLDETASEISKKSADHLQLLDETANEISKQSQEQFQPVGGTTTHELCNDICTAYAKNHGETKATNITDGPHAMKNQESLESEAAPSDAEKADSEMCTVKISHHNVEEHHFKAGTETNNENSVEKQQSDETISSGGSKEKTTLNPKNTITTGGGNGSKEKTPLDPKENDTTTNVEEHPPQQYTETLFQSYQDESDPKPSTSSHAAAEEPEQVVEPGVEQHDEGGFPSKGGVGVQVCGQAEVQEKADVCNPSSQCPVWKGEPHGNLEEELQTENDVIEVTETQIRGIVQDEEGLQKTLDNFERHFKAQFVVRSDGEEAMAEAAEERRQTQENGEKMVHSVIESLTKLNELVSRTRREMETVRKRLQKHQRQGPELAYGKL